MEYLLPLVLFSMFEIFKAFFFKKRHLGVLPFDIQDSNQKAMVTSLYCLARSTGNHPGLCVKSQVFLTPWSSMYLCKCHFLYLDGWVSYTSNFIFPKICLLSVWKEYSSAGHPPVGLRVLVVKESGCLSIPDDQLNQRNSIAVLPWWP